MPNIAMRDSDNITSTFEDMFEAHQFQQLVHRPTRGNSLLDLVLYNTPCHIIVYYRWKNRP